MDYVASVYCGINDEFKIEVAIARWYRCDDVTPCPVFGVKGDQTFCTSGCEGQIPTLHRIAYWLVTVTTKLRVQMSLEENVCMMNINIYTREKYG